MRSLILMYHMISDADHPLIKRYALSPAKFRRQMEFLKRRRYTAISLNDIHRYFPGYTTNGFPEKSVAITFDDGYMDNYENALPVLKEFNYPATIFIVSGLVGKTNKWMMSENYPERPLMGWREIEEVKKNGITIGSHTMNHPRLSHLKFHDAKKEVEDSKRYLEDRLGVAIDHFAYPYGDMNESIIDMVREAGYKTACSTRSGFNSENVNLFQLRRIEIYGTDSLRQFARKLTFGTNDGSFFLPARYYMKRLSERLAGITR